MTTILVLLGIRNRAEAKRKENELKELAEREGRSSEHIKVEEGEVDWLYGMKGEQLQPNEKNEKLEKSTEGNCNNIQSVNENIYVDKEVSFRVLVLL